MNIQEIQEKVQHIRDIAGDDEMAHVEEDDLRAEFIRYVASSRHASAELREMANEVLKTEQIEFGRWCA